MTRKTILSLVMGSMLLVGRAGAQEDKNTETVQRTVVWIDEDGQPNVTTSHITVDQQRAEIEARQRMLEQGNSGDDGGGAPMGSLTTDPGCAGASLWLFDGYALTGNEICFHYNGWAHLADYTRTFTCILTGCWRTTWDQAIRSFWAGVSNGAFVFPAGSFPGTWRFDPWERCDYAVGEITRATDVWLAF